MTRSSSSYYTNRARDKLIAVARAVVDGKSTLVELADAIYEFDHATRAAEMRRQQNAEARKL